MSKRCAFTLASKWGKKDDIEADFVSGIPDSGVGMALGYAVGKQIPYRRGIVKYTPTWPRSFTPSNQAMRELVAKMKLIPNKKHAPTENGSYSATTPSSAVRN